MELTKEIIEQVFEAFLPNEEILEYSRIPYGHINTTYKIVSEKGSYILQRINDKIFKNPQQLIENISNVTDFLKAKIREQGGDPSRETLTLLSTVDGSKLLESSHGFFRMYLFIEGATCYNKADKPGLFGESAKAFGRFQNLLADFDAALLFETIKDFHNTPKRFCDFLAAVNADHFGRRSECQKEIDFFLERKEFCSLITDGLKDGSIPLRVTHNDTKLNNVMIDDATGCGICVIDLDTVMPGSALYDYGDSIRFGASSASEDEPELSKVFLDMELFCEYTKNFLAECGTKLTEKEILLLPEGAMMMTLECGMRFLADYLQGDVYFHTDSKDQNLRRARTQIKLVADMENKKDLMKSKIKDMI